MEDAAVKIRFIEVCHSCNASELTMTIFAVCRYVHCMYASRIEPRFYLYRIFLPKLLRKMLQQRFDSSIKVKVEYKYTLHVDFRC